MSNDFSETNLHREEILSPCEFHRNLDIVCCPICLQNEYDACRKGNIEPTKQYHDLLIKIKEIYDEVGNMKIDEYIAPFCAVLDVIEKHIPEMKKAVK